MASKKKDIKLYACLLVLAILQYVSVAFHLNILYSVKSVLGNLVIGWHLLKSRQHHVSFVEQMVNVESITLYMTELLKFGTSKVLSRVSLLGNLQLVHQISFALKVRKITPAQPKVG